MGVAQVARNVRILQWLERRERCGRIEIRDRGSECRCINMSLRKEVVSTRRAKTGEIYVLMHTKLEGRTPDQSLLGRQVGQPPNDATELQSGLTKG